MAFGFVVARFGLFFERLQLQEAAPVRSSSDVSLWFGTAFIVAGILVNFGSAWRHLRLVRQLDRGHTEYSRSLAFSVASAVFLALVGLAMAIYLISVRQSANFHAQITKEINMIPASPQLKNANNGIVSRPSNHSVNEVVATLQTILQSKGVTLFSVIDHSGEAAKLGMRMPNTKLLIFGSPKAGTPIMLAAPTIALDLPLKILVAEDTAGQTWLSYNSSDYLRERHGVPPNLVANIAVIETLVREAAA